MGRIRTGDGVALNYDEAGEGPPLLLLHGWSQAAALFDAQIAWLAERYRVIALDMRGHGASDRPAHGYRIARLAKDLAEVIEALDLRAVTLLGHSMGCAVIWCYWDLFGPGPVSRLVLVDQPAALIARPGWSAAERLRAGAVMEAADLYRLADDLAGPDGAEVTRRMLSGMVTAALPEAERRRMLEVNLLFPRRHAARLLRETATGDWRDVIPRLSLPTLVVSGRASQVPWQSQAWIHEQIPGSRLEIFGAEEGGSHFMFLEAPEKFNALVADFMG